MQTKEIKDTKKTDIMLVDPRNIVINEDFNVRKDYGNIEELMAQIIAVGQLEPVLATKVRGEDKYTLTEGFRRMRAITKAIELGHDIPFVKVLPSAGNIEDRIFAMVISGVSKKALTVLEEGEAYKRLVSYSYTPKDIAGKIGKSVAHIYNVLKLADAPKSVKNAIENNEIAGTTVMHLLRNVKNTDDLIKVVEDAVADANKTETKAGTKRKATVRNVSSIKTPIQKLSEAVVIATKNKAANLQTLINLVDTLSNKEMGATDIAKLFE